MTENTEAAAGNQEQQTFQIQRIYTKDISFESPNTPGIFLEKDWQPNIDLNLQSQSRQIDENVFEVVLSITVTAKFGEDKTGYLAEVQQAGIFTLDNFNDNDKTYMLGSYCPNLLFPYVRQAISDLVAKGGFPQLLLAPVNFDALLQQKLAEQNKVQPETVQ